MTTSEELERLIKEGMTYEIPDYKCPVCGDEIPNAFIPVYTHIAVHLGELMVKVDKVLESDD